MPTTAPDVSYCPDQDAAETMPEYAARVLRYAMAHGPAALTLSQLEIADAMAAGHVAALPQEMDHGAAVLDAHLHDTRTRLQLAARRKRAQLADLQRLMTDADQDAPGDDAQGPDQGPPQDDQTRALNLLRAALVLIMGPQPPQGGGGRPARLQPPKPTKPSPGIALDTPQGRDQGDGIAF